VVEDVRRDDTFMQVTWHAESGVFVVSHWHEEVCTAATRVPVDAAPDLVNLLVRGLAESASGGDTSAASPAPPRRDRADRLRSIITRWRRLVRSA
jgi:hypothetical protein